MISEDLLFIKKHYGEKMMHLCRTLFPTILLQNGVLSNIISANFEYNRHLADDIIKAGKEAEFQSFIYSFTDLARFQKNNKKSKTAVQLMKEAGYTLYPECKSYDEIDAFRKYYADNELLCTFYLDRLNSCHVFFAVKDNVDSIKREDFKNPERQDEYGTSVISIQFSKRSGVLSIKNRYNHIVENCDATFDNDLDKIIHGLTSAFERDYGLKDTRKHGEFYLDKYVYAQGKYYPYNIVQYERFYCENNVCVSEKNSYRFNADNTLLVEDLLFDFENKVVRKIDPLTTPTEENLSKFRNVNDYFLQGCGEVLNIAFSRKTNTITVKVKNGEDVIVGTNEKNQLVSYSNPNAKDLFNSSWNCFSDRKNLKEVHLPNVTTLGIRLFNNSTAIEIFDAPKLVRMENGSFTGSSKIMKLNCPNLERVGNGCFRGCNIDDLNLPKLKEIGDKSFNNCRIWYLGLPSLRSVGRNSFNNLEANKIIFSSPIEIDEGSFKNTNPAIDIYAPKMKSIGDDCFNTVSVNDSNIQSHKLLKYLKSRDRNNSVKNSKHDNKTVNSGLEGRV